MKKLLKIFAIFLIAMGISGCHSSSSNSSNSTTSDELHGVLLDARVDGIYYKTPSFSGFTKNGGTFSYKKGEVVNFYIGNDENGIKIGSVVAQGIITPDDINNTNALKIVKCLLSISDVSSYLITINNKAKTSLENKFKNKNLLDINQTDLYNYISNNNLSQKIYTDDEAKTHYSNTLASITPKIGILLDLDNPSFADVNKTLIPVIKKDLQNYLTTNKIPFRDINFIVKNTKNNPDTALKELQELKNNGVAIVIGPTSSAIANDLLDYANNNNIILISPSSTAPSLSIPNDNLFRTIANDTEQAKALAYLIDFNTTVKNILPIVRNDIYGDDYLTALKEALTDKNILPSIDSNSSDLNAKIETALSNYDNNDTSIVLIDFSAPTKEILAHLSDKLTTYKWYSINSIINLELNDTLKDIATKTRLGGVTYTTSDDSEFFVYYQTVASKLREKGMQINPFIMNIVDSIWLVSEIYSKHQDLILDQNNSNFIADNIKALLTPTASLTYGSTGFMSFDANGDRESSNFSYYVFRNNKWNNIGIYKHNPLSPDIKEINISKVNNTVDANFTIGVIMENAYWTSNSKTLMNLALDRVNNYFQANGIDFNVSLDITENNSTQLESDSTILNEMTDYHNKGINTVITIIPSRALETIQEYAANNNMYIIDCASTAPSIAKQDTTYRLTANDNAEAQILASHLMKENINNVVLIYVNDVYGTDYIKDFKSAYDGNILKEISFDSRSYLNTQDLENNLSSLKDYTIVYVALDGEGVHFNELNTTKNVQWYGSGSSSFNSKILDSGLNFTFINYDIDGFGLFMPQKYDLTSDLNLSYLDNVSINSYDAVYAAAVSKYNALHSDTTMNESLPNTLDHMYGMSFFLGVDANGDRATLSYGFYSAQNGEWVLKDIYNNAGYGIDKLYQ